MSFLHRRRMDHSSLQERQSDGRRAGCGSAPDTGAGFIQVCVTSVCACDSRPAGGPAHKPRWITTESPGNNLELLGFIFRPSWGRTPTAEQL